MNLTVANQYPVGAIHSACFFTRSSPGEIQTIDPDTGNIDMRPERVLITGVTVDFEGQVCVGEKTIRHFAAQFGMVDDWRVKRLIVEYRDALERLDSLSTENATLREQNITLQDMLSGTAREIFVAADGSRHADVRAAETATRKHHKIRPRGMDGLTPVTEDVDVATHLNVRAGEKR
jgi:hypothetical protein